MDYLGSENGKVIYCPTRAKFSLFSPTFSFLDASQLLLPIYESIQNSEIAIHSEISPSSFGILYIAASLFVNKPDPISMFLTFSSM